MSMTFEEIEQGYKPLVSGLLTKRFLEQNGLEYILIPPLHLVMFKTADDKWYQCPLDTIRKDDFTFHLYSSSLVSDESRQEIVVGMQREMRTMYAAVSRIGWSLPCSYSQVPAND